MAQKKIMVMALVIIAALVVLAASQPPPTKDETIGECNKVCTEKSKDPLEVKKCSDDCIDLFKQILKT
jgi:hypothetical protein